MAARHTTIAEATLSWVERMRAQGYSPGTIIRYEYCIKDFARFLDGLGIDDLRGVRREHIEQYQGTLRSRRLSAGTRAQKVQAVGQMFAALVERGQLLLNPAANVQRLRRKDRVVRRVLGQQEVERLLGAVNTSLRTGIRDRAILEVLYGSAIRIGELCSLSVHDIDLDNGLLRVPRGKGNKGRVVPIGNSAKKWLGEYLHEVRPWWARRRAEERTLFLTHSSRPMRRQAVRQVMVYLCRNAKLKMASPHALRHAAATHMVQAGCDIRYVQKLLGHANLSTTQEYTRVSLLDLQATYKKSHPREQQP